MSNACGLKGLLPAKAHTHLTTFFLVSPQPTHSSCLIPTHFQLEMPGVRLGLLPLRPWLLNFLSLL